MTTFNVLTILVGIITIIANILIAKYNIGKNRKIYEITTGDYAILYVGPCNKDIGSKTYVLGKLNSAL